MPAQPGHDDPRADEDLEQLLASEPLLPAARPSVTTPDV